MSIVAAVQCACSEGTLDDDLHVRATDRNRGCPRLCDHGFRADGTHGRSCGLARKDRRGTCGHAPRIGLALSGGGARGIAHVGVLKVLEEMRIPISCVTGTSMGAIVGGTYAAGRTPQDMETRVVAADWETIFRDAPPRKEIAVRRKVEDYFTLFKPEFGVKDGLALPKGLIAGVSIETFFRELSTPAFGVGDFSKLPIPFRAMATDIETGESVVLDKGSLAQAMRASMSVPGAIAPVEIDGRLLVDGGIANNLPIDEARKLCGEVIIAVNISTPPLKRDEITSALTVTTQLINFLGKQTVDQQFTQPRPERCADLARSRQHLRRQFRPLEGRNQDRGRCDPRVGWQARSLQRLTGAVRRAAQPSGGDVESARLRRRNPR